MTTAGATMTAVRMLESLTLDELVDLHDSEGLPSDGRRAVGRAAMERVVSALPSLAESQLGGFYYTACVRVLKDEAAAGREFADALLDPVLAGYLTILVRRWRRAGVVWVFSVFYEYLLHADFSREALARAASEILGEATLCEERSVNRLGLAVMLIERSEPVPPPFRSRYLACRITRAWRARVRREGLTMLTGVWGRLEKDVIRSLDDLELWLSVYGEELVAGLQTSR